MTLFVIEKIDCEGDSHFHAKRRLKPSESFDAFIDALVGYDPELTPEHFVGSTEFDGMTSLLYHFKDIHILFLVVGQEVFSCFLNERDANKILTEMEIKSLCVVTSKLQELCLTRLRTLTGSLRYSVIAYYQEHFRVLYRMMGGYDSVRKLGGLQSLVDQFKKTTFVQICTYLNGRYGSDLKHETILVSALCFSDPKLMVDMIPNMSPITKLNLENFLFSLDYKRSTDIFLICDLIEGPLSTDNETLLNEFLERRSKCMI